MFDFLFHRHPKAIKGYDLHVQKKAGEICHPIEPLCDWDKEVEY